MLTLYNMLQERPALFDAIPLPDGLERDEIVNAILLEGVTLAPVYGDPELFEQMTMHYFRTRYRIHEQLVELVNLQYDPISNYDRTETESETASGERTGTQSSESETSGTSARNVSAYNVDTYSPSDETVSEGAASASASQSETHSDTRTRSSRIKGNIGVTTTQQMLESSIELMGVSDVYRYIACDYIHTMLITVY